MLRKILFFAAVCVATHVLVGPLMRAQAQRPRARAKAPAAPRRFAVADAPETPVSQTSVDVDVPDGFLACPGSVVPIRATLSHYDLGGDQWFIWAFQVYGDTPDADNNLPVVAGWSYDDAAFPVPMGVASTSSFAEDVVVPPGSYTVMVGVREDRDGVPTWLASAAFAVVVTP